MNDLIGLVAVLMIVATLGFFAAALLWGLAALGILLFVFCLWAMLTTERKAEHSKPSPEGP